MNGHLRGKREKRKELGDYFYNPSSLDHGVSGRRGGIMVYFVAKPDRIVDD